jgi:hypothetical protein
MLDVLLALPSGKKRRVMFEIDETFETVAFCKAVNDTLAMFPTATRKIDCRADIENSVRPIRHDVEPSPDRVAHRLLFMDGRAKPGQGERLKPVLFRRHGLP